MRSKKPRRVWNPDPGVLELVQVLVLLQAGFALLSALEVSLAGLFTGTLPLLVPTVAVTAATALATLVLVAGLGRHSSLARRLVVVGEALLVLGTLADLALALFLAGTLLDLVPMLTQLVLPVAVIVLLRKSRPRREPTPLGAPA